MKRRSHGFTLIELLVVISIIALLISILLPVLSSAAIAGRRVSCQNQLRQIVIGFHTYTEDFDGSMPGSNWYSNALIPGYVTPGITGAGLTVLRCPDVTATWGIGGANNAGSEIGPFVVRYELSSYAYNYYWYDPEGHPFGANSPDGFKLEFAVRPSYSLMLIDSSSFVIYPDMRAMGDWYTPRHGQVLSFTSADDAGPRVGNLLFADGHIEFVESPGGRSLFSVGGYTTSIELTRDNVRGP